MRRIFSLLILVLFPSMAEADCVSYNFEPDPGSGFAGFGRFENSCSYQVVIRFRYSDGQTGLAGPLRPGQTERGYHGEARSVEYAWCDFGASACSPPEIGSDAFKEGGTQVPNDILREAARLEAVQLQLAEANERHCNSFANGTGSSRADCENAFLAYNDATAAYWGFLNDNNLWGVDLDIAIANANQPNAPQTGSSSFISPDSDQTTSASGDDIVPACTDISIVSSNHTFYSFSGGCGREIYCEVYDRSTGERTASEFFNNSHMFHDAYRLVCSE